MGGARMWQTWRQWFAERKGAMALILAALLVGGLLGAGLSSGLVHAAAAQAGGAAPAMITPSGSPQSFADLAEKLAPSVVNIRVTKVERVMGPGSMGPEDPGKS